MKKIAFVIIAFLLVTLAACSSVTSPLAATGNPVGSKVGEAKVSLLFGRISLKRIQDGGIAAAARNGGITRISTVDVETRSWIIGVTRTTIVTGE